jgi:hypothetical protein
MPNLNLPSVLLPQVSLAAIDPSLLKIALVGFIVFVLAILLAFTRRHLIDTSLHGLFAGFITGVVALLIAEAALFFAFKNPSADLTKKLPPNVQAVFNESKESVTQVLGLETEREQPTPARIVADFEILKKSEADLVLNSICK